MKVLYFDCCCLNNALVLLFQFSVLPSIFLSAIGFLFFCVCCRYVTMHLFYFDSFGAPTDLFFVNKKNYLFIYCRYANKCICFNLTLFLCFLLSVYQKQMDFLFLFICVVTQVYGRLCGFSFKFDTVLALPSNYFMYYCYYCFSVTKGFFICLLLLRKQCICFSLTLFRYTL